MSKLIVFSFLVMLITVVTLCNGQGRAGPDTDDTGNSANSDTSTIPSANAEGETDQLERGDYGRAPIFIGSKS